MTSSQRLDDRKYISSHFVTQRGTVAFERLKCKAAAIPSPTTLSTTTPTPTTCTAVSSTPLAQGCSHNNCLRQFLQSTAQVSSFCATYTLSSQASTATAALPSFVSQCSANASKLSSACSCVVPATTSACSTPTTSSGASTTPTAASKDTYIRILFNDAVYPIPSCQSGPGKSCLLDSYATIVKTKLSNAGNLIERCNVTAAGSPTSYKGASFFTDLTGDWISTVAP